MSPSEFFIPAHRSLPRKCVALYNSKIMLVIKTFFYMLQLRKILSSTWKMFRVVNCMFQAEH